MSRIYWYHTGMDLFSDYKSLVLVCGMAKWYGSNSDYDSLFTSCLTQRSPPTLLKFSISLLKSHFLPLEHQTKEAHILSHSIYVYWKQPMTAQPRRTLSMLISPTEHPIDSPSAHFSPTQPKVVYTRKVVCIPLLITTGLPF